MKKPKTTKKTKRKTTGSNTLNWHESAMPESMPDLVLHNEFLHDKVELAKKNRTLEIIDLILADKKLEAIELLRSPYDFKVNAYMLKGSAWQNA